MSVEAAVSIGGWLIDGYANSVPLHFVWTSNQMQSLYFLFTSNKMHCIAPDSNILTTNNSNCLYVLSELHTKASFVLHICFLQPPCVFRQTFCGCTLSELLTNVIHLFNRNLLPMIAPEKHFNTQRLNISAYRLNFESMRSFWWEHSHHIRQSFPLSKMDQHINLWLISIQSINQSILDYLLLTAHFDASSHDRLFGQPTPAIQRRWVRIPPTQL